MPGTEDLLGTRLVLLHTLIVGFGSTADSPKRTAMLISF